jgi:energy-coupling factor transporter ATP-binding protein EcfA2
MRLKSLRLKDIGPLSDTIIEFPKGADRQLADVYLLVGQNGCGKTTALEAIASLLNPPFEPGGLSDRLVSRDGAVVLETSAGRFGAVVGGSRTALDAQTAAKARALGLGAGAGHGRALSYFSPPLVDAARDVWLLWARAMNDPTLTDKLSWAAFAYSGSAAFQEVQVTSISEITEGPLNGALNFGASTSSQRLAQWVVLQDYRYSKTTDAKRRAELKSSLDLLDQTVSEIIGTPFRFVVPEEELTPQACVGAQTLALKLLPRGLQAIIGWLGDLLMRLDRLPWVENLPPSKREFLLLLDEIDLHLHPAWQRRILPAVQKLFPKAQVIASTHSPFVVASLRDGAVIELRIREGGRSEAQPPLMTWASNGSGVPHSYSGVLSRLFGIDSDFDPEEERQIKEIQALAERVMRGEREAFVELEQKAKVLQQSGDEYLGQLVEFEVRQARASLKA